VIVIALLPKTLASQRTERVPIREAGIWMKMNRPQNAVIMTQGELRRVTFYAEGIFVEIPRGADLLAYAKDREVDFLAFNQMTIEETHPGLTERLDSRYFREEVVFGKAPAPYVIRIYSVSDYDDG
jgi:hypothetical protein